MGISEIGVRGLSGGIRLLHSAELGANEDSNAYFGFSGRVEEGSGVLRFRVRGTLQSQRWAPYMETRFVGVELLICTASSLNAKPSALLWIPTILHDLSIL